MREVAPPLPGDAVVEVGVRGMHCAGCAASVEKLVGAVPGVVSVRVDAATGRALLQGRADWAALEKQLARGGYGLATRRTLLGGLGGPGGSGREALLRLDGVRRVEPRGDGVEVEHVDVPDVLERIRELAERHDATLTTEGDPERDAREQEVRAWRRRFLVALPAALWVMLACLPGAHAWMPSWAHDARLLWSVALPTLVLAGGAIFARASAALRRGRPDMDVLVGLGIAVAFVSSTPAALGPRHDPLWLDSALGILVLVCLGRWLEARARGRAGEAVANLARLAPASAWLVDGAAEREVPLARVLVGDRLRVKPGGSVPVDGVVRAGQGALDESLLTGESEPVLRRVGDPVVGGSVNLEGVFDLEATARGTTGTLARIATWVREARLQKAPLASLADRIAAVFVPVVLVLAVLTAVGHALAGADLAGALEPAVAVLVVACPCALGLATPVALVVAHGRAAQRGILLKGGAALERAARVDVAAFDKTGTLTEGRPAVLSFEAAAGAPADAAVLAAGAAAGSEHPLSRALVAWAGAQGCTLPPAEALESRAGEGLAARVAGREVHVGRRAWLVAHGAEAALVDAAERAADASGATCVHVAVDGRWSGTFLLRDRTRASAAPALAGLAALGVEPWIVSGDRRAVVEDLARELGVGHALAGVAPLEKAARVREAATAGRVVALVGDGVKDAPALAEAEVGIAVGRASAVSVAAASIALTSDDLTKVPEALALARATVRVVRQNLGWAFAYNLAALPAAALGALDPAVSAGLMALSSLSVVLNSLRLKRFTWAPAASR